MWIYKHMNITSRTALRVTSWAFYHIIYKQKPKGFHSNSSKYKFGLTWNRKSNDSTTTNTIIIKTLFLKEYLTENYLPELI